LYHARHAGDVELPRQDPSPAGLGPRPRDDHADARRPIRLEIVRILGDDRPRVCNELSSALGIPASTGSYHLRLLREAGITRTQPQGTLRLISLRRDDLDEQFPGLLDVLTR
jgi:DNA-binding transcriptional ArsR family regulator